MELMTETKTVVGKLRKFESANYVSTRDYFENGIIDGGYDKIHFDFSECNFENENYESETEEEFEAYTITEDDCEEEIIEELD